MVSGVSPIKAPTDAHLVELGTDRCQPHTLLWYPQVSGSLKKSISVVVLLFVFLCTKENVLIINLSMVFYNNPQVMKGELEGIMQGKGEAVER